MPPEMLRPAIPSSTRNQIIASAIPALSGAAGRTKIPGLTSAMNIDMNIDFKPNGGVWGRVHEDYGKRWLHNDMKDMAYYYTHLLFEGLVETGGLQ